MRILILGGGPAGLYSAILLKKSFPDAQIEVQERNRADDTFGFGIVLSDETLSNLKAADEPSWRAIADNFAYWDDIHVYYKGHVMRSGGHGFSGLRRLTLLQILQRRAEALGVMISFTQYAPRVELAASQADLVIAADGINSDVRQAWAQHFKPETEVRPNKFVWLGADMMLPGFTYAFNENSHGIWNLHAYMFTKPTDAAQCTFVFETTDAAFKSAGLDVADEARTASLCEEVFAEILQGHKVLTNRSHWRNFPTIHCGKWHHENVVLLGDAAHTAHWSIGSGTKLALEDAIALHAALVQSPTNLRAGLEWYETARREGVEKTQHAANTSLLWF